MYIVQCKYFIEGEHIFCRPTKQIPIGAVLRYIVQCIVVSDDGGGGALPSLRPRVAARVKTGARGPPLHLPLHLHLHHPLHLLLRLPSTTSCTSLSSSFYWATSRKYSLTTAQLRLHLRRRSSVVHVVTSGKLSVHYLLDGDLFVYGIQNCQILFLTPNCV